jgi:6-pyruvoyltetrahydropterin/6-carboxytetrahydropterin synthase
MKLTRRYRFSASHRLHTEGLSDEANRELYGKCNNPFGHGHDYVLDVTVAGPIHPNTGQIVAPERLDRIVRDAVLRNVQHSNLNAQLPEFRHLPATTENLAVVIRERLQSVWPAEFPPAEFSQGPVLTAIRLEETRRNSVSLEGAT